MLSESMVTVPADEQLISVESAATLKGCVGPWAMFWPSISTVYAPGSGLLMVTCSMLFSRSTWSCLAGEPGLPRSVHGR